MAAEITPEERERRAGKNQSLFRDVNERVNDINKAQDLWVTLSERVCECVHDTCTERIQLTRGSTRACARIRPTSPSLPVKSILFAPSNGLSGRTSGTG
jgi:hypothetical protein